MAPPGLTLAWAKSTKFDASPALPLPAGSARPRLSLASRLDMARCSAASVSNPAKDGTGTRAASAVPWLVGRVNGGFIITRSAPAWSITGSGPLAPRPAAGPVPLAPRPAAGSAPLAAPPSGSTAISAVSSQLVWR